MYYFNAYYDVIDDYTYLQCPGNAAFFYVIFN